MAEGQKYKYLDKEFLNRINYLSREVMKYNRSLPQEFVDSLPDDRFYIITFTLLHEHIAGKPADPHVRCLIYGGQDLPNPMILDMEMGLYEMLPEVEAKEKDAEPEPAAAG
jgi:hypothetical protein